MCPAPRAAAALALAVGLGTALAPAAARAGDGVNALRWEPRRDLVLTGAALALWFGSEAAKERLAPSSCRFCGTNALDAAARDALVWADTFAARRASDVITLVVLPGVLATHQLVAARDAGEPRAALLDALLVAQAVAFAGDATQLAKFAVGRQRPFVRYGGFGTDRAPDSDDDLSFYSGHASLAFSMVAAAGTVSSLRGYRSAPWVWGVGLTLAAGVAWLRVGADEHYLTDVLTGAAVGTAFGIAVPRLLHGREREGEGEGPRVSLVPLPLGVRVAF